MPVVALRGWPLEGGMVPIQCVFPLLTTTCTKSEDTEHIVVPSVVQIASFARHTKDFIPTRKWTQTDFCASTHHLGKQQQGVAVLELARVVRVLWRDVRALRVTGLAPVLCQILLWVHNQLLHLSHSLQYLQYSTVSLFHLLMCTNEVLTCSGFKLQRTPYVMIIRRSS